MEINEVLQKKKRREEKRISIKLPHEQAERCIYTLNYLGRYGDHPGEARREYDEFRFSVRLRAPAVE